MAPTDYNQRAQNGMNAIDRDEIFLKFRWFIGVLFLLRLRQEVLHAPCEIVAFQAVFQNLVAMLVVIWHSTYLAIAQDPRYNMKRPPTPEDNGASVSDEYRPDLQDAPCHPNKKSSDKETASYRHASNLNLNRFDAGETIPEKANEISKAVHIPDHCVSGHSLSAQLGNIFKDYVTALGFYQNAEERTKQSQKEEPKLKLTSVKEELICKELTNKVDPLFRGKKAVFSKVDNIKDDYLSMHNFRKKCSGIEAADQNVSCQPIKGNIKNPPYILDTILSKISNEPSDGLDIPKQNGADGGANDKPSRNDNCGDRSQYCGNACNGGSFSCSGASGGSNGGGNGDNGRGKKNSHDMDTQDDEDDGENDNEKKKGAKKRRPSRGRLHRGRQIYIKKSSSASVFLDLSAQVNFLDQGSQLLSTERGKKSLKRLQHPPCSNFGPRTGQMSKNAQELLRGSPRRNRQPEQKLVRDSPRRNRQPQQTPLRGSPRRNRQPQQTPLRGSPRHNRQPQQTPLRGSPMRNRQPQQTLVPDCPRRKRQPRQTVLQGCTRRSRKPQPTMHGRRWLSQVPELFSAGLKRPEKGQSGRPEKKPPKGTHTNGDNSVTCQIGAESPTTQKAAGAAPRQRKTSAPGPVSCGNLAHAGSLCQGLGADSQSQANNSRSVDVTAGPRSQADSSRPPVGNIVDTRQDTFASETPGDARQVPPSGGFQEPQEDDGGPGPSRHAAQCQEDIELERLGAFGPPQMRAGASGEDGGNNDGPGYLGAGAGRMTPLRLPRSPVINLRATLWAQCEEDREREKERERMLQLMQLADDNERMRRIVRCPICMIRRFTYLLLPCSHTACDDCANTRSHCHCGQEITGRVRASFTL